MHADLTKTRQLLLNLLSNACKFTHDGVISLGVDREPGPGGDWLRFEIADTGIGIDAEKRENLFKEFSQADNSIARKYGGTGLGLAITSRFVELMQGSVEVDSEPGQGSTFTVRLPAEVPSQPDRPTPPAAGLACLRGPSSNTALVIDDDPAVRDLMTRSLTRLGFAVEVETNGEDGLRRAAELQPCVITLDVMMPEVDGWEVLKQLKKNPTLAAIPVIMLTVVDNPPLGLGLGASGYLVKPVDRDRLADLVEPYRPSKTAATAVAAGVTLNA